MVFLRNVVGSVNQECLRWMVVLFVLKVYVRNGSVNKSAETETDTILDRVIVDVS